MSSENQTPTLPGSRLKARLIPGTAVATSTLIKPNQGREKYPSGHLAPGRTLTNLEFTTDNSHNVHRTGSHGIAVDNTG